MHKPEITPPSISTTFATEPRAARPCNPLVLCSGLPQAEAVPHLLKAGAVGLIRKPFRMTELWQAVGQALRPLPEEAARAGLTPEPG